MMKHGRIFAVSSTDEKIHVTKKRAQDGPNPGSLTNRFGMTTLFLPQRNKRAVPLPGRPLIRRLLLVSILFLTTSFSGCRQIHVGFARFQLINQTPYTITYYGVAATEAGVQNAPNRLAAPLGPSNVADADVKRPGHYWLRAIANVEGNPVERIAGPVEIFDGNRAWAWYVEDGAIRNGTEARDIYGAIDLPAVIIDTHGAGVPDEPKVPAAIRITSPDGLFDFEGNVGIEVRGNSSQTFDKLSYGLETWDTEGGDVDVTLLGLPGEEDWVLYGPWMDRSLVRNVVGYTLWESLGYYAPRTRFVELYLNTDNHPLIEETYHGVYVLTEKVKRDRNRVDIARLGPDDTAVPAITGGYLLEMKASDQLDQGQLSIPSAGAFVIAIEYPKAEDMLDVQRAWITTYLADFEAALFGEGFADPETGYGAYIDVDNFIDYILLQDFFKNRDAFRSSTWMYKERGKKLRMGPVWDLNIIFGYFSFNGFNRPDGWFLQHAKNDLPHSPWTDRLFEDPAFVARYIARWRELRANVLSTTTVHGIIDRASAELRTAHARNFMRWQTLGRTLIPDLRFLMFTGPHPDSWQGEVRMMKDWADDRAAWMDDHMDELVGRESAR